MFQPRTAMYLTDVYPRRDKREDGTTEKQLILKLSVQPFTAEMAADLNVKTRLFASDGAAHPDVLGASLAVAPGKQSVTFYRAPDPEMPVSIQLRFVKVEGSITVRQDKETTQFAATITLNAGMPDANDVLRFFQGHAEQWFVTFEREQGDMLDDAAGKAPELKGRRKKDQAQQPNLAVEAAEPEAATVQ